MATSANPQDLGILAKTVLLLGVALIVAGAVWHGVTMSAIERFWRDLLERATGPMKIRFLLQPLMAIVAAIPDALADAREARSPYFAAILWNRQERIGRLREGLNATARIILIGLTMDLIYQVVILKMFYPTQAVVIALALAFLPYVLIRGLIHRAARRIARAPLSKIMQEQTDGERRRT